MKMNYVKKSLRVLNVLISLSLSFILSLVGTATSGHFTVKGWLLSFALSFVLSLLIVFKINMKMLEENYMRKHGLKREDLKTKLVTPLLSDLVMTPILTVAMVALAMVMSNVGMSNGIKNIEKDRAALQAEIDTAEKEALPAAEAELAAAVAEHEAAQKEVEDAKAELAALQADVDATNAELVTAQEELEVAKQNGIQPQIEGLSSKVAGLQAQVEGKSGGVEGLNSKVAGLTEKANGLNSKVEGLTSKVNGVKAEIAGKSGGVAEQTKKIEDLEKGKPTFKIFLLALLKSMIVSLVVAYFAILLIKPALQKMVFRKLQLNGDEFNPYIEKKKSDDSDKKDSNLTNGW